MWTRRRFLKTLPAVALAGRGLASAVAQVAPAERPVVARIRSELAVANRQVRVDVVQEMVDRGLRELTGAPTAAAAWSRLLDPGDVVGFKFDPYGENLIRTAQALGRELIGSVVSAGWPADRILVMDAPPALVGEFGVRAYEPRWSEEIVDLGVGPDHLSSFVHQVTAIVNVPFLKNDHIFGVAGSVKNITYDLLKHPARYHAGRGDPSLVRALALPQIRRRVRLNVINGLRTVYHGGPLVEDQWIDDTGALVFGQDPVATDAVGIDVLSRVREFNDLSAIRADATDVPMLVAAASQGLGEIDYRRIARRSVALP